MLDAVVDYLPAPTDVTAIEGMLEDGEDTSLTRKAERRRAVCCAGV